MGKWFSVPVLEGMEKRSKRKFDGTPIQKQNVVKDKYILR